MVLEVEYFCVGEGVYVLRSLEIQLILAVIIYLMSVGEIFHPFI